MTTFIHQVNEDRKKSGDICSRPSRRNGKYTRCGSVDYSVCPSCASLNRRRDMLLMGSGIIEGHHYFFLTLTAPSFGKIHTVPKSKEAPRKRCSCGSIHEFGSPLAGVPVNLEKYDYAAQIRWNRASSILFTQTMKSIGRSVEGSQWCAVREYQSRAAIHYHTIVRVPDTEDAEAVYNRLRTARETKTKHASWGRSTDVKQIVIADSENTIRYMSKVLNYSAKTLGRVEGLPSAERTDFYRRLVVAAQRVPNLPKKAVVGFGYGGQLFTKSKGWTSLTKVSLKEAAREFALEQGYTEDRQDEYQEQRRLSEESARALASKYGSSSDFTFDSTWTDRIRTRI